MTTRPSEKNVGAAFHSNSNIVISFAALTLDTQAAQHGGEFVITDEPRASQGREIDLKGFHLRRQSIAATAASIPAQTPRDR